MSDWTNLGPCPARANYIAEIREKATAPLGRAMNQKILSDVLL
jgi:hypothetical protein